MCGPTESSARSLIRTSIRAGVPRGDVLEPAIRFEAYELAKLIVEEYARAEAGLADLSPEWTE